MKNNSVSMIIVAVLIAGGSFFGGMKYQQSKQPAFTRQFSNGQFGRNGGPGISGGTRQGQGVRPVAGEIIASDEKSITVKLVDGSSKIVFLTDKTMINKAADAKKEDLKTGEKVAVFGMENSDGSMTAQSVQLDPIIRGVNENQPNASAQ